MQSSPAIRHGEVARRMAQGAASVPGLQEEAAALDSWAGVGGAGPQPLPHRPRRWAGARTAGPGSSAGGAAGNPVTEWSILMSPRGGLLL